MIILVHGSNRLAIDERLQHLREEHDPTQLSTTIIDGAAEKVGELRSAIGTPAFFGGTRLVIAHHLITRSGASRPRRASKRGSQGDGDRLQLLRDVPASTLLILIEDSFGITDEREVRRVANDAQIERYDVPRGRGLVDWACDRARRYDATLPADVATRLLETLFPSSWQAASRRDDLPPDLYRMDVEIAKLATAAGAGGRISVDLVDSLVAGAEAQNIWGLTNAITAGDPAAAVHEAERALAGGAAPEMLIGQLTSQLEVLAALTSDKTDLRALGVQTGLTEARLRRAANSARHFPATRVRDALAELRALDLDAKRGRREADDGVISTVAQIARPAHTKF